MNIGNFKLTRPIKGDMAIMTIELDGQLDSGVVELLKKQPNVAGVVYLRAN